MKTDKQLLELLRDELPGIFQRNDDPQGLCRAILVLYFDSVITKSEANQLEYLIYMPHKNRQAGAYYFPPGAIQPRIDYLNQLIEKL